MFVIYTGDRMQSKKWQKRVEAYFDYDQDTFEIIFTPTGQ